VFHNYFQMNAIKTMPVLFPAKHRQHRHRRCCYKHYARLREQQRPLQQKENNDIPYKDLFFVIFLCYIPFIIIQLFSTPPLSSLSSSSPTVNSAEILLSPASNRSVNSETPIMDRPHIKDAFLQTTVHCQPNNSDTNVLKDDMICPVNNTICK
jgi:hypothetical protein